MLLGYCLGVFGISIGVVIRFSLVNYSDTLIGFLFKSSVDFSFRTLIGLLMGALLGNYLGRSLETFLGFPLYFYLVRL